MPRSGHASCARVDDVPAMPRAAHAAPRPASHDALIAGVPCLVHRAGGRTHAEGATLSRAVSVTADWHGLEGPGLLPARA